MLEWSFVLKKMLTAFCMPLPLFYVLLGFAVLLFWRRKLFLAKTFSVISMLFLYLISIEVTGDFFGNKLESQYPGYQKNVQIKNQEIDYVLVLGSSHFSDSAHPISSLLSPVGLTRLVEGVRIYRLNPGSKLLLSGYRFDDEISHAQALKKVALHFAVPAKDIVLAEQVKDTQEEASHWMAFAEGKSLVLVTSASHMPRSMFLFEHAQKNNTLSTKLYPAPTGYISHQVSRLSWRSWFPSGHNMYRVERVWHEYLGLLWARLVA
tara:strand:+ start:16472 stop:17263 length:792 start_codon:yes stop_codon:yes gene_type:complete